VAGRVTGLHLADWPRGDEGVDARVLPGEGRGESASFVAALRAEGWEGALDVEIFSTPDGFWSLTPEEAARRAYAAVSALA
jgi:sugar phosphate isomerase/epimerase